MISGLQDHPVAPFGLTSAIPQRGHGCEVSGPGFEGVKDAFRVGSLLWSTWRVGRWCRVKRSKTSASCDRAGAECPDFLGRHPGGRAKRRVQAMIVGWMGPEWWAPGALRCCRATSESSCGMPMRAPSLTKGYGGNPPSGRSVSPPRTGPFFSARRRLLSKRASHTLQGARGRMDVQLRRVGATRPTAPQRPTNGRAPGPPQPRTPLGGVGLQPR